MNYAGLNLIKTRRSVRAYCADAVPENILDALLEAGTYAPTAGGRQSPVIVAVKDPALRKQIAAMNNQIMGGAPGTDPYYGAPIVLLILADGTTGTFVEDGTCVLANLMLAAHAVGLASVWVHREREMFDNAEGKALLKQWGLSENLRGVGALALGYATDALPKAAPRKADYIVKI